MYEVMFPHSAWTQQFRAAYVPVYPLYYLVEQPGYNAFSGGNRSHGSHSQPLIPFDDRPATYPPVDSSPFRQSAETTKRLLSEAGKITDRIASSSAFASELMSAAQRGEKATVERLVKSIGVKDVLETTFTPDGIRFQLRADPTAANCCVLMFTIRWGKQP